MKRRLLPVLFVLSLVGSAGGFAGDCTAEDPPTPPPAAPSERADLPKDWVAQCGGRTLTLRGLAIALVNRSKQPLLEPSSGETTVLRQLIEERVVAQEAKTLGIVVTEQEVTQRYDALDRDVRERSGGKDTLRDVVAKQHVTMSEFRTNLAHLIRKERIASSPKYLGGGMPKDENSRLAQVEAVVTELLKRSKVLYGIATAAQPAAAPLPPGEVVEVNGERITTEELGLELARRLPADDVLRIIKAECKSVLSEASALTEQEMEDTIQKERANWNRWRGLSSQEALKTVSYDDYVKAVHHVSLDDLKKDRFFRGLFGLIRSFRSRVKPEEVEAEYKANKETLYGASIRVTDVQINFVQKNALLPQQRARERKDALRLANEILVKKESGMPFDQIAREVNARRDQSMVANSRRVRNTDNDRILFEKASSMADGAVAITETISAVHVIHRESAVPAPPYEDVREMIAEGLAKRAAEKWLDDSLADPKLVRIRWPIPD